MLSEIVHLGDTRIHGRQHVHRFAETIFLIMNRTRWVELPAPFGSGTEIASESRLIAQRPHYYGDMVALLHHMPLDAIDIGDFPCRVIGDECDVAHVFESVTFQIGFGHDPVRRTSHRTADRWDSVTYARR